MRDLQPRHANAILARADYRDVQKLGDRIGVPLPLHYLEAQAKRGYSNFEWDTALHELGHFVLEKAWRKNANPDRYDNPIDEGLVGDAVNKSWRSFLDGKFFGNAFLSDAYTSLIPSEWTVNSWCCEMARRMGWLTADEVEELLDEGLENIKVFKGYLPPFEEIYSLKGYSADCDTDITRRQLHALQMQRMADYGIDFAAGQFVPTRTARREGPYVQIVDATGIVQARFPGTLGPEAAPLLWAMWNWEDVFGSHPPGMDLFNEFRGKGWQEKAKWWTQTLNEALVRHALHQMDELKQGLVAVQMLRERTTPA